MGATILFIEEHEQNRYLASFLIERAVLAVVNAASGWGKGSTFTVTLRAAKGKTGAAAIRSVRGP